MFGNQVALGDLNLFVLGVAGQPDHLQPVEQRRRHGMEHVRGGDEKHLAQVVFDIEIVIHEHVVLFGIEHFHQGGRRVATEVGRHLVELIEHEDGVYRAGLLHHLDDLARQRANVGAAVAANLGFVTNAAQRQADELASGGAGDRLAQRRFPDARRPHEAQNGPARVLHQAAHREELEDALFDLVETIVVVVEHLLGEREIPDFPRFLFPRHGQQPIDIVA